MRQVAIEAASLPKDAKIAVLEKSSAESEKKIAEARSDQIKHSAEIQASQKRMTDMDTQLRAMESELLERDSIIKILQNRAFDTQPQSHPQENVLSIPIQDSSSLILHPKQVRVDTHTDVTQSISSSCNSIPAVSLWSPLWLPHPRPPALHTSATLSSPATASSPGHQGQRRSGIL